MISLLFSKLLSNALHEVGVVFWCLLWGLFWDTVSFHFAAVFQDAFKRSPWGWCCVLVSSLGFPKLCSHFVPVWKVLWAAFVLSFPASQLGGEGSFESYVEQRLKSETFSARSSFLPHCPCVLLPAEFAEKLRFEMPLCFLLQSVTVLLPPSGCAHVKPLFHFSGGIGFRPDLGPRPASGVESDVRRSWPLFHFSAGIGFRTDLSPGLPGVLFSWFDTESLQLVRRKP